MHCTPLMKYFPISVPLTSILYAVCPEGCMHRWYQQQMHFKFTRHLKLSCCFNICWPQQMPFFLFQKGVLKKLDARILCCLLLCLLHKSQWAHCRKRSSLDSMTHLMNISSILCSTMVNDTSFSMRSKA